MRTLPLFGTLLGAVLLNGCVVMAVSPGPDLDQELDAWVGDREYGRALDTLARVDPKSPDYQRMAERRRQIEALASTYEKDVVAQAQKDVAKGDWAAALDAYDAAIKRMPGSTVLKDGLAALHRQQSAKVAEQQLELLISRAQWLKASLPVYARIARISPRDSDTLSRYEAQQVAVREVASRLGKMGAAALEAGEHGLADRTLPLAAELSDEDFIIKASQQLKAWHAEQKRQQQAVRDKHLRAAKAREAAAKRRYEQLSEEYRRAVEAGRLTSARTILRSLEEMAPNDTGLLAERRQLESQIDSEANRLFEEGVGLYSRGEFDAAAKAWRATLELNPHHRPAAENLERAERVLERIRQLREKQAQGGNGPISLGS